jgi:hypothetical protein
MKLLLISLGIASVLYVLHRVLTAAEYRGWVYYRNRPPRIRFLGLLEELVEPRVEYLIEEESSEAIRADVTESGDRLEPGHRHYRESDGPGHAG